jgi:hypothetical protein
MDEDIKAYVSSCKGCQLAKARISKKFASHAIRIVSQIFAVFSMDLIDMGAASLAFRYILVLMDYYSGFVVLYNLRRKTKKMILAALWDAFTLFGPPQTLLSDRGSEFLNDLVDKFTENSGITHVVTYAYHAQANGKNERSHQVINHTLRILVEDHPSDWYHYTKGIQYMMNTRPNLDNGITPYEILFGMKPRSLGNVTPFLEYNHADMTKLRSTLNEMITSHQHQKILDSMKTKPLPLEIGAKVKLVKKYPLRSKLKTPALGPYTVMEQIGTSGYRIQHDISGNEIEAPREWLQTFIVRKEGGVDNAAESVQNDDVEDDNATDHSISKKVINEVVNDESEDDGGNQEKSQEQVNRELKKLEAYNKVPEKNLNLTLTIGHMIVWKDSGNIRIAEIIEDHVEDWLIHWYGSSTNKNLPRNRWKFYPVWEDKNTGDYVISKSHSSRMNPSTTEISKESVFKSFEKLNLNGTIPENILREIEEFTLY